MAATLAAGWMEPANSEPANSEPARAEPRVTRGTAPCVASLCAGLEWRSAEATREAAEQERLADWLESQSRVIGFWMERLAQSCGDAGLMAELARHRDWLSGMRMRLGQSGAAVA